MRAYLIQYHSCLAIVDNVQSSLDGHYPTRVLSFKAPPLSRVHSCSRVAYCDVTGRESRLPLKMRGEGVGPRLQFSFDTLDIQNVFVNSAHAYEVGTQYPRLYISRELI